VDDWNPNQRTPARQPAPLTGGGDTQFDQNGSRPITGKTLNSFPSVAKTNKGHFAKAALDAGAPASGFEVARQTPLRVRERPAVLQALASNPLRYYRADLFACCLLIDGRTRHAKPGSSGTEDRISYSAIRNGNALIRTKTSRWNRTLMNGNEYYYEYVLQQMSNARRPAILETRCWHMDVKKFNLRTVQLGFRQQIDDL
jgi:hypothetical protein